MAFKVNFTGVDELAKRQLVSEVSIERRIYDHSLARIVLQWDDAPGYDQRQTANIAAKMLNCTVDVQWKDRDLTQGVDCFHGYVECVTGEREAGRSRLIADCVSFSKRTDMVARYRAFQATTLLAICQQIAKSEPLVKIDQSGDLSFDIPLSLQYGETDYQYLSRMLHAWGIPMAVIEKTGEVSLGARGSTAADQFPDLGFRWSSVAFYGTMGAQSKRVGGGSGPTGTARSQNEQFNGQLVSTAADYFPIDDSQPTRERVGQVNSQVDTSAYRLLLEGAVLPFTPGQIVKFEGQDCIIRKVGITGHPRRDTAAQEFELQAFTLPYQPERGVPVWPSRNIWAYVMDNKQDPTQSGRIQVKFDLENLDPQSSSDRVWLPLVTPYGGGKSPSQGKAGSYNGFYSVPEIGERVLVQFIGEWDSQAVVLGAVRDQSVGPMYNPQDTKRWRMPSGNEVAMTTKDGTDVVRIRCQDQIFFESKMSSSGAEVYITPGGSDGDLIYLNKGSGPASLYILGSGNITVQATQNLHLEGQMVQIKASGGNVNIDGAPNVMINCVPMPAMPLQKQLFQEEMLSTSSVNRQLPTPAVGTAASGDSSSDQQQDQKKTWIEIILKDDDGNPVPNEPYRIKLADGSIIDGTLDAEGRARVDGIDPGSAMVSFPERSGEDWQPA